MKKPEEIAWFVWNQLDLAPEETIGDDHMDMYDFTTWLVQ